MTAITNDTVVLVTRTLSNGTHVQTFSSVLSMVRELINTARLGGTVYGDDMHKKCLDAIEEQLRQTRERIAQEEN